MRPGASISAHMASFLDFCRIEKGLARTTIESYRLDLERFARSLQPADHWSDPECVRRHIDSLYRARMASRSIARHLTTLRNLYRYLLEKGIVDTDPTANLTAPKQWQSLPKYLNKKQIDDLMASCDSAKPQVLRDTASLESF
jgi:site-specific recombinase XerD